MNRTRTRSIQTSRRSHPSPEVKLHDTHSRRGIKPEIITEDLHPPDLDTGQDIQSATGAGSNEPHSDKRGTTGSGQRESKPMGDPTVQELNSLISKHRSLNRLYLARQHYVTRLTADLEVAEYGNNHPGFACDEEWYQRHAALVDALRGALVMMKKELDDVMELYLRLHDKMERNSDEKT